MSDQLHAPAALSPGTPLVTIAQGETERQNEIPMKYKVLNISIKHGTREPLEEILMTVDLGEFYE
jgi:hypothetical protein